MATFKPKINKKIPDFEKLQKNWDRDVNSI